MPSTGIDPFYYKQPPLLFVDELRKPVHTKKPTWFQSRIRSDEEVCAKEAYLISCFPDPEELLVTVQEDFNRFLSVFAIEGDRYPIYLQYAQTECFEAYRIIADNEKCTIEASDTEGIRRGLIYIEDEMLRRSGPFLPKGTISRKPYIRERITRGFFSPTNRPPKNVDELMDDVDYYPDEYLNRLAHDGTNGLWIYTYFNQLLPSDCFTEYGKDSDKRLEKLKRIVRKCKRYGIKVWVFGVEPFALAPEIAVNYPDSVGGIGWNGHHTVCTYSELGAKYCIEVTQRLMEEIPDLGGIIDITYGERPTTCASLPDICQCPRCRKHSRSEIIAHNIDLLKEGIRRAGSKADFVSWTYAHRVATNEEIREYVIKAPSDVILQENFEDNGYVEQLGKIRHAIDYWLSYTGPSQMFLEAANTAVRHGKKMFAKMQVCCSHEVATVPYVPVPGILYDKYAAARELQVQGVMQCWYFGNYPSLMSKAAGELAFWDQFSDKNEFLKYMAGIYFGPEAEQAVRMWGLFAEGYQNYPVNIMFGYYGPMQDGVVWELALEPRNTSLPRSWQLLDKPDGDRISECLQSGHTLDEAVILCERMSKLWRQGIISMPGNCPAEQRTVALCLDLLFSSGYRILRFYQLREKLVDHAEDAVRLLDDMEVIVRQEIQASEQMANLCKEDSRLGYHSEAEGYKFFAAKLEDRVSKLQKLLDTEFVCVRKRVASGISVFPWYEGKTGPSYQMAYGDIASAEYAEIHDQGSFRIAYDDRYIFVELQGKTGTAFRMHFEYRPLWPAPSIVIKDGKKSLTQWALGHQSVFGDKIQKQLDTYQIISSDPESGHYVLKVSRETVGWLDDKPMRLMIAANDVSWITEENPVHLLGKNDISPGEFGWLLPESHDSKEEP